MCLFWRRFKEWKNNVVKVQAMRGREVRGEVGEFKQHQKPWRPDKFSPQNNRKSLKSVVNCILGHQIFWLHFLQCFSLWEDYASLHIELRRDFVTCFGQWSVGSNDMCPFQAEALRASMRITLSLWSWSLLPWPATFHKEAAPSAWIPKWNFHGAKPQTCYEWAVSCCCWKLKRFLGLFVTTV